MTDEQTTADETASEGIIRQMSDTLANKIAAGEVVQRPASVAKELIENALDAGASSVEVVVKDAGSTLVQVVDDGCGMSRADARRCFDRHATSKIRSVDDLERIRTLGFRGEALASIASVAQVEMKTKRVEDAAGTLVKIEGGETVDVRPCAAPNGTSIAVRNLFYNVPARRNFLKTPATELKHISETFQFLALSNPHVAFRLTHNDLEHYDLAAARSDDFFEATRQRIIGLLGEKHEDELLAVEDASSGVELRGFVRTPGGQRKKSDQFLFVNDRYVEDRYLSHAVRKAYDDLLPDKSFPFFVLFLSLDPKRVDVNVHPTKAEVKFDDQSGVYGFIKSAVRRTLRTNNLSPELNRDRASGASSSGPSETSSSSGNGSFSPKRGTPTPFQPRSRSGSGESSGSSSGSASPSSGSSSRSSSRHTGGREWGGGTPSTGRSSSGRASSGRPDAGTQSAALYGADASGDEVYGPRPDDADDGPIWSLHDTYLMTPTEDGMWMVDQRAAHVRVLYERARRRLEEEQGESQQLLFPHQIDLQPADADLLDELTPELTALGFDLERMSGGTVVVRGVPVDVRDGDETTVLEAMLEPMRDRHSSAGEKRRKALAKTLAQNSAVRRGQRLSEAERRALLRDLYGCEMPYADPSGTPTMVHLSLEELRKRFGG